MNNVATTRGVDFLDARSQVVKAIRRSIENYEEAKSRNRSIGSVRYCSYDHSFSSTLLAVPAVCCILLVVSLASQTTTNLISGLLVSLLVIMAVVLLNIYLYQLVSTAESNEIKRELEEILHDYEKFSDQCMIAMSKGAHFIHSYQRLNFLFQNADLPFRFPNAGENIFLVPLFTFYSLPEFSIISHHIDSFCINYYWRLTVYHCFAVL